MQVLSVPGDDETVLSLLLAMDELLGPMPPPPAIAGCSGCQANVTNVVVSPLVTCRHNVIRKLFIFVWKQSICASQLTGLFEVFMPQTCQIRKALKRCCCEHKQKVYAAICLQDLCHISQWKATYDDQHKTCCLLNFNLPLNSEKGQFCCRQTMTARCL